MSSFARAPALSRAAPTARAIGRSPAAELEALRNSLVLPPVRDRLPADWQGWVEEMFGDLLYRNPRTGLAEFSEHHAAFWQHVFEIRRGVRPRPYVACWPRGHGKSSTMEMAVVALGSPLPDPDDRDAFLPPARTYFWYISATQAQADDHVQSIGELIQRESVERHYPLLAERAVNTFGHAKGWRRSRLWTRQGLIVDSLGLDTARRGVKLGDRRPDGIILDDVDADDDSLTIIKQKIDSITKKLLPAGTTSGATALFFVQNRPNVNGIMAQMIDGRADFLQDRIVSGPIPSLRDMETERVFDEAADRFRDVIVAGTPTWSGQSLPACQQLVDNYGLPSFRLENQHEERDLAGGIFSHVDFPAIRSASVPDFIVTNVWVDPAVSNKDNSDAYAITAGGLAMDGRVWMLYGWESTPGILMPEQATREADGDESNSSEAVLTRALLLAYRMRANRFGIETDQGGNTWYSVYRRAIDYLHRTGQIADRWEPPGVFGAKAGSGLGSKAHRWRQMSFDYDTDRIRHLATSATRPIESALYRVPAAKPFDLADSTYWAWRDLRDLSENVAQPVSFSLRSV